MKLPLISVVAIDLDDSLQLLVEGKWIDGRYTQNIRIDRDTHFADAGEKNLHGHVYGRHDRTNALVAVRQSGAASHGLKGVLHKKDADALRAHGIDVPASNIIEWTELPSEPGMLLLEAWLQEQPRDITEDGDSQS